LSLEKLHEKGEKIREHLRLRTFPVAIRLCKDEGEFSKDARRPSRDFKHRIAACQAISMTRMYGWTLGLTWEEDMWCIRPAILWGIIEPPEYVLEGTLMHEFYNATVEAAKKSEEAWTKIPVGSFCGAVFSPLERTPFEPHVIAIYGTPAQMCRLIGAALWKEGGALEAAFQAGAEICHKIARAYRIKEPQVVIPGGGDRVFTGTEDDEMAMVIPMDKVDEILEGLKSIKIVSYPIPKYIRWEPRVPRDYKISYHDYMEWLTAKKKS